jgi:hypothetical protein
MSYVNIYPKYIQKKSTCRYCGEEMEQGTQAIKLGEKRKWWAYCYLHIECALPFIKERVVTDWYEFFNYHEFENRMGRKRAPDIPILSTHYGHNTQTTVQQEKRRLKNLRRYHKKALNLDKVEQIDIELKRLEEIQNESLNTK